MQLAVRFVRTKRRSRQALAWAALAWTLVVCCQASAAPESRPAVSTPPSAADLRSALAALQAADRNAGDQRPLRQAWLQVSQASSEQLPEVLDAMSGVGPLAENWLRAAADAVAERELREKGDLPRTTLEQTILDRRLAPRARRVAFEWLAKVEPQAPERLLPRMLDDPSLELRLDAVALFMGKAAAAESPEQRRALYQTAYDAALDVEQVQACGKALAELGADVDLARRLGFVLQWRLIGPFDNGELKGFAMSYPPETGASEGPLPGKQGPVEWKSHVTSDPLGRVDLNAQLVDDKEVVGYALAEVVAKEPFRGQLRLASLNAPKVWFNGALVGAFEVYHAGSELDQYVMPVEFEAGVNRILVKLSQNEKKMSWEKAWEFQLRATDELGAPAPVVQPEGEQ
jgi:hypothetical protein